MIKETDSERIDKYLWSVRLYKTRNLAKKACESSKVLVNGQSAKPSRIVSVGDTLSVKQPPILKEYKILKVISNRVGAKLVPDILEDLTPPDEYDKLKAAKRTAVWRDKGTGRPTKKERRDMEDFLSDPKF